VLLLTVTFRTDFIGKTPAFSTYQINSENLALARIVIARDNLDIKSPYGLGNIRSIQNFAQVSELNFYAYRYQKNYLYNSQFVHSISRYEPLIAFPKNSLSLKIIKAGNYVELKNKEVREIIKTQEQEEYVYAYITGDVISDFGAQGLIHDYLIKSSQNEYLKPYQYYSYRSQIGLQGWIYYLLTFIIPKYHLPIYRLALALLLSITIVTICYQINKKYNSLLAACFYLTFWLSPIVISLSYNLYWVEVTWFIPMLLGILSVNYKKHKLLFYFLFFLAILIKSLCGYEYVTTVMMGGIIFPIVEWLTLKDKKQKKKMFYSVLWIGVSSLLGFIVAFSIHAIVRGDGSFINGAKIIYDNDVLRRTLGGNPEDFDPVYHNSFNATIFATIAKNSRFPMDIVYGIPANVFNLLSFSPILILAYEFYKKGRIDITKVSLYVLTLLATLSWFILGKAHSFIHASFTYILWYFGFVQVCFYIILSFFFEKIKTSITIK
jgi:hypothetical protein